MIVLKIYLCAALLAFVFGYLLLVKNKMYGKSLKLLFYSLTWVYWVGVIFYEILVVLPAEGGYYDEL